MDKIEKIISSKLTVFNTKDLAVLWKIADRRRLIEEIKYYLRTKKIVRIFRGIYTLPNYSSNYSSYELIQKIVPLSYISLTTALAHYGIVFQYEDVYHSMALISKKYNIDNKKIIYHQIKEEIFLNSTSLIKEKGYTIASPERAICDTLYIFPKYSFDNIEIIEKDKLIHVSKIYKNKRLEKEVKNICLIEKDMK